MKYMTRRSAFWLAVEGMKETGPAEAMEQVNRHRDYIIRLENRNPRLRALAVARTAFLAAAFKRAFGYESEVAPPVIVWAEPE